MGFPKVDTVRTRATRAVAALIIMQAMYHTYLLFCYSFIIIIIFITLAESCYI